MKELVLRSRRRLSRLVPPSILGVLDYYRSPELRDSWGGPFNGQIGRGAIFDAILAAQEPRLIVETGTFRGTTTEKLATAGTSVETIEAEPRNYGYSRVRLRKLRNVSVHFGDSRQQLRELFQHMGPPEQTGGLFAYLDAHWNVDLPLAEELDVVFAWDPWAIVMIDDFQVPGDAGYGFDDYGPGCALVPDYVGRVRHDLGLAALYPVLPSQKESGARRGCVVLASEARWKSKLLSTGVLRLG